MHKNAVSDFEKQFSRGEWKRQERERNILAESHWFLRSFVFKVFITKEKRELPYSII